MALKELVAKYGLAKVATAGVITAAAVTGTVAVATNTLPNASGTTGNGGSTGTGNNNTPNTQEVVVLSKTSDVCEYGNLFSMNPVDYVVEGTSQEVLNGIVVDVDKKTETGREKVENATSRPEVGTYYLVFTYGEEVDEVTIEVKDTQAPVINLKQTEVTLDYGKNFNANSYVTHAKDPVDGNVKITVEGEVDTKKAGTYTVTYKAVDKNGNEGTATLKVTVKEKKNEGGSTGSTSNKDHDEDGKNDDDNIIESKPKEDIDCNGPIDGKYPAPGDGDSDDKPTPPKPDKPEPPKPSDDEKPGAGDKEEVVDDSASMGSQPKPETPKEELKPWTPEEVPYDRTAGTGMAFATWKEASRWADAQVADPNSPWYGKKYQGIQVTKNGQKKLPNDPWVVKFY